MDYIAFKDDKELIIETKKEWVKNNIIEQFVSLRKEKGYTQEDIANATGIARPNVARIEGGKNSPSIEILTKLAYALDMELEIKFVEKTSE